MKKIVISSVALFVVSMTLGFLIHGLLMHADYEASGHMRPLEEQETKFPFMIAAHALIAIGFTLIYRRGREDKPWLAQGLRYGLLWAIASVIPTYLVYHAVMPWELGLVCRQIAFDTVGILFMGVVVAAVNKEE